MNTVEDPRVEGELTPSAVAALLSMDEVSKSFGETRALVGANIEVRPGEIHALAGENGSGKTTLIKVVSGVIREDAGRLAWKGTPVTVPNPIAARRLGIATVYQETLFAAEQTVTDNIFMGLDGTFVRKHSRAQEAEGSREILSLLGADYIDINAPLWALSLAERQLVTIARAVVRPWSLLILDEGTSALDSSQRDRLFAYLRAARDDGRSVLFTSHRMDEIESLADTVSVLRSGSTVLHAPTRELTPAVILAAMAGRDLDAVDAAVRSERDDSAREFGRPAITAHLPGATGAVPATITVREGEVLGLAGLEGQGQAEFLKSLAGLVPADGGSVVIHGPDGGQTPLTSFRAARRLKVAYVPQDRKNEGLFFTRSTLDNFSIGLLPNMAKFGIVSPRRMRRRFEDYVPVVKLLAHDPNNLVGTLSGGNQQKVLLARWLATEPRVLLLSDPMRGVDANTKAELHALLHALAAEGLAIVLLSTEVMELLALCDSIAVFHDGGVEAVLDGATATNTDIVAAMFGHAQGQEGPGND